jgi:phosphogluconate dehydratase
MPVIANLQDAGYNVALLTDGRLSGASGKVPAVLHLCPEALMGGEIGLIRDGDIIEIDAHNGTVFNHTIKDSDDRLASQIEDSQKGLGRELFSIFRENTTPADQGALSLHW